MLVEVCNLVFLKVGGERNEFVLYIFILEGPWPLEVKMKIREWLNFFRNTDVIRQ